MTALALGVARLYRTRYQAVHTEPGEARGDLSQLHRGTAEYCVLALLRDGDATASTGPRAVRQRRGLVTSEGTIYPLLTRLRKDQLVTTTWREYEKAAKESRKDDVTLVSLLRRRGSKNWGWSVFQQIRTIDAAPTAGAPRGIDMEHPNAALIHKADELLDAGDFPAFLALHNEDVVMHVPGSSPLAGDHHGRDGIAALFQKEMGMLDAPPQFEALDDLGSDDHAAAIILQRLRRGGREYAVRQTVIARVKDGQFSEVWILPEDQAAFDAIFASS